MDQLSVEEMDEPVQGADGTAGADKGVDTDPARDLNSDDVTSTSAVYDHVQPEEELYAPTTPDEAPM
ncbi:TPA: hypothetical protein N0F65_001535 [Lagenidium giganteum]|uniref:Uncharacterized protein n=1 Tax=Lagenidium giganteum TaxID=4803 RepID=A0AAV2YN43_9STRA|nr:TPA: hypothetical protein N0F65_001535 [Lagenidium giganteum]